MSGDGRLVGVGREWKVGGDGRLVVLVGRGMRMEGEWGWGLVVGVGLRRGMRKERRMD